MVVPGAKSINISGPGTEELYRLNILEKKRRRGETLAHGKFYPEDGSQLNIYNNNELYNMEATLSGMDCDASSSNDPATLAKQDSHS